MEFFRGGGPEAVNLKPEKPARPRAVVRIKIEGEGPPKQKKGKGQQAAWRSMTEGRADGCPTEMDGSLWDLVHDRWVKGEHREMKVLSWDRQRKAQMPEMPTEACSRLEFAKALADDHVVRSKEKVTWASYRGWWMVFMEFMRFVGVDQCGGAEDWRMSVEVLRLAAL